MLALRHDTWGDPSEVVMSCLTSLAFYRPTATSSVKGLSFYRIAVHRHSGGIPDRFEQLTLSGAGLVRR